jgi:hypothetical protein
MTAEVKRVPSKYFRHCGIHSTRTCSCNETSREAVLETWRDWLSGQEWDDFITVTYRAPRAVRSDGGDLSRVLRTIRRYVPQSRVFLAGEAHVDGNLHVHGIVQSSGRTVSMARASRTGLWRDLFKAYGRSEVRPVRESEDVLNYCTKYVTKRMSAYLID